MRGRVESEKFKVESAGEVCRIRTAVAAFPTGAARSKKLSGKHFAFFAFQL